MSKRFNKKKSVRFVLVPGTGELGNPTTMFKPVETRTKLSKKEREKLINQISDYQIQIDGKPVNESELPSFVLEQIKGRADLVFNQKNPDLFFNEQDEVDQQIMEKEEQDDYDYEEGQLIPQQQYMEAQDLSRAKQEQQITQKNEKTELQVQGKKYEITKEQMRLLDQVLPEDYENYKIEGVQFVKYDQDGLRLDEKQKYKKYLSQTNQKKAIIDSYIFIPEKPVDVVDNDMDGEVLKGDLKDVDEALNFDGEQGVYQQLQDDFFSQLLGTEKGQQKKKEIKTKPAEGGFKKNKNVAQIKVSQDQSVKILTQLDNKKTSQSKQIKSKLDELEGDEEDYQDEEDYEEEDDEQGYEDLQVQQQGQKITDEMLDKALKQFEQKQVKYQKNVKVIDYKTIPGTAIPAGTKGMDLVKLIQSRQQCVGRDGQLDWRTLTKKQKKQYMKNKQIRQIYDEAREKEIKDKMVGKVNIKEEDLHLKQYIKHIEYSQDHVMQEALKRNENEIVNIEQESDYETDSDQDDIISYRAKTSIISSNLATVEERGEKRKKKNENDTSQVSEIKNIEKIKVIMQKRNKNETPQQRKERKQKLKELKKQKKQQKKQFSQVFFEERKKVMKKQNTAHNPLYKVSYIKIV